MIDFINGAFGAGKPTLAERLVKTIPGRRLYDLESAPLYLENIKSPLFARHLAAADCHPDELVKQVLSALPPSPKQ